jgi:hypothetical protein
MRMLPFCLLSAALLVPAWSAPENDAVAAVQRLFDGMAAHDGAMIRSVMLPDARIHYIRDASEPSSIEPEEFIGRIAADKSALLERFTSPPRVLIRGRMAQVWGEYEFRRDGKFSHCGVDSASLFQTAAGWIIAAIVYTAETTGCKGQ